MKYASSKGVSVAARTIHPFPARMAPEIATNHISAASSERLIVLDPMCGSGTVLSVASTRGHQAIGVDLDPLAAMISNVATQPVDTAEVKSEGLRALAYAKASNREASRWTDPETERFARYWFDYPQRTQLTRLSLAIDSTTNPQVKAVLRTALSRIIITKTPRASLAADTSHSRPHRIITTSDYDVYAGFSASLSNLATLLDRRELQGSVQVYRGDARSLALRSSSIDLVITSPPYLNAIDYMRAHKFALIWMGYTIPTLRTIRAANIGAERAPSETVSKDLCEMLSAVRSSASDPNSLPLAMLTRYAHDLTLFAQELYRVCKSGADVISVIGNSTRKGNYIPNDLLLQLAYERTGFRITNRVERALPQDRRYLPTTGMLASSSLSKRMRTEIVLSASK